jgi:hypothetical protein
MSHPRAIQIVAMASIPAVFAGSSLLTSTLSVASPPEPHFINTWRMIYPNSLSDDNVVNGTGSVCQMCHRDTGGDDPWNPYGWRVRQGLNAGSSLTNAILAAETFDSDMDPTGSTNLEEIMADTQPGWTDGPNNTIFFESGSTSSNQLPPAGILGQLDPTPGLGTPDPACVPVANSTGSPALVSLSGSGNAGDTIFGACLQGPPAQFGYFISGPNPGLYIVPPGSTGNICIAGPQFRYNSVGAGQVFQFDAAGISQAVVGGGPSSLPTDGSFVPVPAVMVGESRAFQAWYRDGPTSNFADSRIVTFN